MRQNGVRGLDVTCLHCGHQTAVNVDAYLDDVPVPSFGPRMRCTSAASSVRRPFRTGSRGGTTSPVAANTSHCEKGRAVAR
jgi:hypothetical protein